MMQRVLVSAVLVGFVAACGGDGKVTEPRSAEGPRALAAVGTDPTTGATIETNQDDYLPGEVVHLTGRGWAPNETVHLFMREDPDTHGDVSEDVQADSTGAFALHFYDVQPHDLGVTFTLTATGQSSRSVAVVTFTDGRPINSITFGGNPSITVAPGSSVSALVEGQLTGASNNTLGSIRIRVHLDGQPATSAVVSVCFDVTPDQGPSVPPAQISFSHTITFTAPATAGTYDVTGTSHSDNACAVSAGADTHTEENAIVVQAANAAPVLAAIGNKSIGEGSTLTFTASATDSDVPAQTLSYSLISPPPGAAIVSGTGVFTWIPADGPQSATITVRATDNGTPPMSDEETITVTVNNVAPVVSAGADANIIGGATFAQAGSFTDPGADTWTATVDYGDGSGSQPLTLVLPAKTFALNHAYTTPGNYTVTVSVTDDDGETGTDQVSVNVANNQPVVSAGGDQTINEGATFAQNGSFTDPDADTWTATVDYGDGSGPQVLALTPAKGFSLSHVYTDNGVFTVTVTVTDNHGSSGTDNVVVTVNNIAPVVTAGADETIDEGSTFSRAGSFTDPGADTWTATVNYGDGSGVQTLALTPAKTFALAHTYTDNGTYTVTVTVTDDDGAPGSDQVTVTVNNVPPVVSAGVDATIDEGTTFTRAGSFTDPGADTWTATVDYGDGSGVQPLALTPAKTFSLSHLYQDNGTFTITVTVSDDDGGVDTDDVVVTVKNVLPVVSAGADASLNEGDTFSRSGSFSDPGADTWTATVNYGDGTGTHALSLTPSKTFALSHLYADNGNYTVTVTVTDDDGGVGTDQVTVSVSNVLPVITSLSVPLNPVAAGTNNVTVTWTFTDPGVDTWGCQISWDAGQQLEPLAPVFAPNDTKTCSATKTLGAGIYSVTVQVTDDDGGSDSETATTYIVVYDPSAGFVTGGGWINSPSGAYPADPALTGKANFGFVSKYKKGQTVPDGNTEFQFHAGNLNFKSIAYEWLVVSGARAQFKGTGSINGGGTFGFMLSAIDGQVSGGGGVDRFRMKIWTLLSDGAEGPVIYDNQMGGGVDAAPTTALGGGSINIQSK